MTKPKGDRPGSPGLDRSAKTTLEILHASTKGEERRVLFGAVAERIRSGMLDPAEADLIAGWFDSLAQGDDPKRTLYGETRGRKRGATGATYQKGEYVRLPDHVDLCWMMRRAMSQHAPDSVFSHVAQLYGVTPEYVSSIWESVSPTLADDPDLAKK